jgi:hypothetical protein
MNRFFAIYEVEQPNGTQKLTIVVRLHEAIRVPPIGGSHPETFDAAVRASSWGRGVGRRASALRVGWGLARPVDERDSGRGK